MEISTEENFYSAFEWFYEDLNALRHEPVEACALEGNYNVAHELWYLIPYDCFLDNSLGLFTPEQLELLADLFAEVRAIPPEARVWATSIEDSVNNMSHSAWSSARVKAQKLYICLAPIAVACKAYLIKNA